MLIFGMVIEEIKKDLKMPMYKITEKSGSGLVSLAKARRILGAKYSDLTDTQVRDLLYALHLLAKEQLKYNGSNMETKNNAN